MKYDMTDLLAEYDGIGNLLCILSNVAGKDYEKYVGSPMPDTMQSALFAVARQVERVTNDLYELDHETAKEA